MNILNLAFPVFCHARMTPQQTALVVNGREYTYEGLAGAARRVAAWIQDTASRDDRAPRIGILAARSFETYAGILGTAWGGAHMFR